MTKPNHIDHVRAETIEYLKGSHEIPDDAENFQSPNGKYSVQTKVFKHGSRNIYTGEVQIFEGETLLFEFLVNESTFFHSWISKDGIDYLICAEDLCGGQTVIDLTSRKMVSYTADEDGFMWGSHALSPDGKHLAVCGCGWGTAAFVIVYNFENPMQLPLPVAAEPDWTGFDLIGWENDTEIRVKNASGTEEIVSVWTQ